MAILRAVQKAELTRAKCAGPTALGGDRLTGSPVLSGICTALKDGFRIIDCPGIYN